MKTNQILKQIFWDIDVNQLDVKKSARPVIERVLELGDLPQVHWMLETYPTEQIIEVVKSSRQLSPKSANFWADFYNISKDEVRCLNKSFREKQKSFWPY